MTLPQCRNPRCEHDHALISWMDVYCCMPCRVAHRIGMAAAPGDTDDSATDIGDYAAACQAITAGTPTAQQAGDYLKQVVAPLGNVVAETVQGPVIVPSLPTPRLTTDSLNSEPEPYKSLAPVTRAVFTPPPPGWLARLLRRLFG